MLAVMALVVMLDAPAQANTGIVAAGNALRSDVGRCGGQTSSAAYDCLGNAFDKAAAALSIETPRLSAGLREAAVLFRSKPPKATALAAVRRILSAVNTFVAQYKKEKNVSSVPGLASVQSALSASLRVIQALN